MMGTQRRKLFIRCTLSTLFVVAIGVGVFGWTIDFSPVLRWISSSPLSSSQSTTTSSHKATKQDIPASRSSTAVTTTTKTAHDQSVTKQKHANEYDASFSSSSCHRICNTLYRNTILYTHDDTAGLYDRAFLIQTLGDMAGYLCATLEIRTPHDLLSATHNFNQSVSSNMSWYDFYNLSVAGTNGTDYTTILVERDRDTFQQRQTIFEKRTAAATTTTAALQPTTVTKVKTSREGSVLQDLVQVEAISWNSTASRSHTSSFVWEISVSWWLARKYMVRVRDQRRQDPTWQEEDRFQMLPNFVGNTNDESQDRSQSSRMNRNGCSYLSMDAPKDMQLFLDDIWKNKSFASDRQTSTPELTGMLHIRRGDAIQDCDTSLEQMKAYFDCTFDGISILSPVASNKTINTTMENDDDQQRGSTTATGAGGRNAIQLTLLLASDERDAAYRQGVTQLLQTLGILVVDADEMIEKHLQQAVASGCMPPERLNNYYAFRLLDALKADLQKISFVLERRRKRSCRACDRDRVVHAIAKVTGVPCDEEENGET
jgi:hypothetical protein